jgi:FemAB-related protein (PEP-CTERM system-associated)
MTGTTTTTTATIECTRTASVSDPPVRLTPVVSFLSVEPRPSASPPHDGARTAWSAYVESAPRATLFHHPLWSEAVQAVFGHRPLHLVAKRGSSVVGLLPLMEVRSLLAGRLLVSVPYATYGGILADDEDVRDALASEAVWLARRRGARVLELRSAQATIPGFQRDERYAGFFRALPERLEDLQTFLPRKARAAARQARQREQLTVRHDTGGTDIGSAALQPVELVWSLYARNMRRLGSLAYPRRFFTELVHRLQKRAWVTTVWRDRRPIAGLLSFVFGDTVMPYFVGVDERVRRTGCTNLLYLAVMERAVVCGLRRFDLGRSRRANRGSFAFKRNQGFEPQVLGYQRFVPPGRKAPDLTPSNPRFAVARRLWRHLPLSLACGLGGRLSRWIPG